MKKFIKFKIISLVLVTIALLSCSDTQDSKASLPDKIVKQPPKVSKNQLEIQNAKIMGWWWHKTIVEKGIDGENPPKKENYVEIVNWQYDGEGITTYPKKVDFISSIFNNSKESFSGTVTFNLKVRYGNYDAIIYGEKDDSIDKDNITCEDYPLIDEGEIFKQEINLNKEQKEVIKKTDFSLKELLVKEVKNNRICSLQLEVTVYDFNESIVAQKQAIMPITLGD